MRDKRLIISGLVILILIASTFGMCFFYEQAVSNQQEVIAMQQSRIAELELAYFEKETLIEHTYIYEVSNGYECIFSNYYTGDADGSTTKTGSGLTTSSFEINDMGWYTYKGMVVLAGATWSGIESNYGNLAKVHDIPSGYRIYHYGDEVTFMFRGVEYKGIILDTCYISMIDNNEKAQRYDIFIADKSYSFGLEKGVIYE